MGFQFWVLYRNLSSSSLFFRCPRVSLWHDKPLLTGEISSMSRVITIYKSPEMQIYSCALLLRHQWMWLLLLLLFLLLSSYVFVINAVRKYCSTCQLLSIRPLSESHHHRPLSPLPRIHFSLFGCHLQSTPSPTPATIAVFWASDNINNAGR